MSIRDRLGRVTKKAGHAGSGEASAHHKAGSGEEALDIARYKYVLRVASPQLLEQIHREAFEVLPPDQVGPLYLKMCHDLPEGTRPTGISPEELARAAVSAQQSDHGYMLRALRRPGQGVSEGHSAPTGADHPEMALFHGSLLGPFAAAVVASTAASEVLAGFDYSPEAAQVDPSLFVRGPNTGHDAWSQVATGGYDMGGGHSGGAGGGG